MPTDKTNDQVRPFADFLQEINAGVSHSELSRSLMDLSSAVAMIGKTGSLTYTVKVSPAGRGAETTMMVTDSIRLKLPEGERADSVFFLDSNGNLTRHNPAQIRLPLREVPGGVVVDNETGEIKEAN